MKILELRFKNLNSLHDEWFIDFTDPEYVSNGIFALTGPTGAGKSTILDAICLALYGATPRLGKITKAGNEIMSRQAGECYAEVLFESQTGQFRCHWEQRRARKKPGANLQPPQHEIARGNGKGKVIEHQLRRVQQVVEEKTGMDFERFTRSILLAQGGFDTFLKADVEQKSKILEQITGTGIYTEISKRVHERRRDEREKLDTLQAAIAGIHILEPDQEKEIRQNFETARQQEADIATKAIQTEKAIAWLNSIHGLKKEINTLAEESTHLHTAMEAFHAERKKLALARNAARLDGDYATLSEVRKQQLRDQSTLNTEGKKLPALEISLKNQRDNLKTTEQQTISVKEELKKATPLLQKIRALDQTLESQKKTISEIKESCNKEIAAIESRKKNRTKEQKKRTQTQKKLETITAYLKDHSRDEWLVSGLAGVEEQLARLLLMQKEISPKKAEKKEADSTLKQAKQKLTRCTKRCAGQTEKLKETTAKRTQAKEALEKLLGDRLLREYRREKETLLREMSFLKKIAQLEEHRMKLEDGAPCPLCGAKEHPFARGNVPIPDETEKKIKVLTDLIENAENQKDIIQNLEKTENTLRNSLSRDEKNEAKADAEKKAAEKNLSDLRALLENSSNRFNALKQIVSEKLIPLGIDIIPDDDLSSLLDTLKKRLHTWQAQMEKKTDLDKQMTQFDSELNRLDGVIENQLNTLAEKQYNLETLKKENSVTIAQRRELYKDKKPDREEQRLHNAIARAEQTEKQAKSLYDKLQQKWTSSNTTLETLEKQITQRKTELKRLESQFITTLLSADFSDEKQFLKARLTPEQREIIGAKAKSLDDAHTDLTARQKDRETRLATETARKLTANSMEILEPELKELKETLNRLRETIAGFKHQLTKNKSAGARIKKEQTAIDVQKKECRRWEKLHELIGSADGKKYRNFAQGLTFELMVSHANAQLEKMTDRYLLIRDKSQPLELNVVDNYQAGEIRSTRNLSGGESFIVSLTLALGLSRMASRRVRVDSLFLDEGFGTLDDDALETALETLSGLQQDAKLIGIISHVSALKERISTQINITPESGGRSTISGPGCCKVTKVKD
ncbi:exonuclease SbcC [Desulfocicer vacuolatum DSM 3385]|uniref:Exonuclease SbcC n=1 Tax=Desulfocicer vacuolatum DSM 3385 TaxID=1121400 RepID=A0A1W2DJZ7_9BACT|nr:AAA family ATPase [Desulfocicer vacuolatum]SMC97737.1 exonuclease SbcC [Desulfocicer vacuolatum DSM 3385]